MTTNSDLAREGLALAEKATKGWRVATEQDECFDIGQLRCMFSMSKDRTLASFNTNFPYEDDMAFAAFSRTHLATLCRAVLEMEERVRWYEAKAASANLLAESLLSLPGALERLGFSKDRIDQSLREVREGCTMDLKDLFKDDAARDGGKDAT